MKIYLQPETMFIAVLSITSVCGISHTDNAGGGILNDGNGGSGPGGQQPLI
jgi:hypothetical protein